MAVLDSCLATALKMPMQLPFHDETVQLPWVVRATISVGHCQSACATGHVLRWKVRGWSCSKWLAENRMLMLKSDGDCHCRLHVVTSSLGGKKGNLTEQRRKRFWIFFVSDGHVLKFAETVSCPRLQQTDDT
jgi:hypothetical protein